MIATADGSTRESGLRAAGEVSPWVQAIGIGKPLFYSLQGAEFRQAAFFADDHQDIIR
jgi:hypothetical protein